MRIIRENALRLDRMVTDVLELSRRDRGRPEELPLREFVETFVEQFVQAEKIPPGSVHVDVPRAMRVRCDREHLHRIVWNLCRNAWRHCSHGHESVRISANCDYARIELRVADNGPGVPEQLVGQLFEPFFTTYSGGTGLGLYIARELCAANGAELVYAGQSGGAVFSIQWPAKLQ